MGPTVITPGVLAKGNGAHLYTSMPIVGAICKEGMDCDNTVPLSTLTQQIGGLEEKGIDYSNK
jgi:hypothetical protein